MKQLEFPLCTETVLVALECNASPPACKGTDHQSNLERLCPLWLALLLCLRKAVRLL